ncbi:MAG: hypothetical protein WBH31_17070 [Promethearchaeia archaeon]
MSRHKNFGYRQGRRGSNVFWIFMGVLAFCLVFFPILGINLTYYIGSTVTSFFVQLGSILSFIGNIFFGVGIICLFIDRNKGIKYLIIGAILIIGAMIFIDPLNLGIFTGKNTIPQGYH